MDILLIETINAKLPVNIIKEMPPKKMFFIKSSFLGVIFKTNTNDKSVKIKGDKG